MASGEVMLYSGLCRDLEATRCSWKCSKPARCAALTKSHRRYLEGRKRKSDYSMAYSLQLLAYSESEVPLNTSAEILMVNIQEFRQVRNFKREIESHDI
jgi:hypothetical protein